MGFLYLIPAIAGGVLLYVARSFDLLSHPLFLGIWWVTGLFLQFLVGSPFDFIWLAGLLANVILALYLSFRLKLG